MGRGYQSRRTSGKASYASSVSPNEAGAEGYSNPPLRKDGSDWEHFLAKLVEMRGPFAGGCCGCSSGTSCGLAGWVSFLAQGTVHEKQEIGNASRKIYTAIGHPKWVVSIQRYLEQVGVIK